MTEPTDATPTLVEIDVPCERLGDLPELPVSVLVLSADGLDREGQRGLARRLEDVGRELGVGDGIELRDAGLDSWSNLEERAGELRADVVVLRPGVLPASEDAVGEPARAIVATVHALLEGVRARFWTLDPPLEHEPEDLARRWALARAVVGQGGPPAVLLSERWTGEERLAFHLKLFEWILHDTPLEKAVARAAEERAEPATLVLCQGRRHGLDLGRLLEDHRRAIDELASGLRVFRMELAAAAPRLGEPVAEQLEQARLRRTDEVAQIRSACEEIGRDRDPAGWSRLAEGIQRIAEIAAAVEADRSRLGEHG